MHKTAILPQGSPGSGWAAILPPRTPRAALQGQRQFDWLVLGAGFGGLMAARRLAQHRPQDAIALIDAGELGQNASGRNAGFAIDLPHLVQEDALSPLQARAQIRLSRQALGWLRELVQSHGIDCQWSETGRHHCAVSSQGRKALLDPYILELQHWGEAHEVLERQELASRLGTAHYHSAVYTPGTVLLNPAALCRGLGESLPPNVELLENSPVTAHDLHGTRPTVQTHQGRIVAGKAILAANVFAGQFGVWQNRQLSILLTASLSAPLDDAQLGQLGSLPEWGLTPANGAVGPTMRLTQDKRLLLRHGFAWCPGLRMEPARLQEAKLRHQRLLAQRFPQLGALPLEHSWMGWLALSSNQAPLFGQLAPNLYALACCNGVGIVRHTVAGAAMADLACGVDSDILHAWQAQTQAALLPPRPFLDIGVHARLAWERFAGRRER